MASKKKGGKKKKQQVVKLVSTEGSGDYYTTKISGGKGRNKPSGQAAGPIKLVRRKYDKKLRKHVEFKMVKKLK